MGGKAPAHRRLLGIVTAAFLSAVAAAAAASPAVAARHSPAAITAGQPPGYQIVHGGPFSAPPGAVSSGFATCPAGTVVWGGGTTFSGGGVGPHTIINTSEPNGTGGWAAKVSNSGTSTVQFSVDAICANKPTGYKIVSRTVDNLPSTQSHATATCPLLDVLLGGGTLSTSSQVGAVLTSAWPRTSVKFTGYMYNGTTTDAKFTVLAICGHKPTGYMITSNGTTVGPGLLIDGIACPTGTSVVDGGTQDPAHLPVVQVIGSIDQDTSSWIVGVANDGTATEQVNGYAICAA